MPFAGDKKKKAVDQISKADLDIFKLASKDARYFTDHYMRSPASGTYWRRMPEDPEDEQRIAAWQAMWSAWKSDNQPREVWKYHDRIYKILWDEDGDPVFHDHHGWLWQPWQLQVHHSPQEIRTIIGGYGSGKTAFIAMHLAVLAATIPNFRGFSVAPQMQQALEVYRYLKTNTAGTPWYDRWVTNDPLRPYPSFTLKNSYIGESSIELYSVADNPDKVKTLEGDDVCIDQAEQFDDLDDVLKNLGTRLRGSVFGRAKLGLLNLIANSKVNPDLWYIFDMAEFEPKIYGSWQPKSEDNPYLSKKDLERLRRFSGKTEEEIEQGLHGARPMGSGKHFPASVVQLNLAPELDNIMVAALTKKIPGYIKQDQPRVGVYRWEMPPDFDSKRQYIVIADPGQSNPPDRNSAAIMTWDVTEFPYKPARLRAFHWVSGNGSYWPFVSAYTAYVEKYHAQARNGFDSTGTQTGMNELVFATMNLAPEGINLAGNGKMLALNALKFFMGKGLMQFPYISHLINQLTNYDLPDTKLKQDLVMTMAMSAVYMRRYYFEKLPDEEQGEYKAKEVDRYGRKGKRYVRRRPS